MKRILKYVIFGYLAVVALHSGMQLAAMSSPTIARGLNQFFPVKALYLFEGRTVGNAVFGSGFLNQPQKYLSPEPPENVDEVDIFVVIMSADDPDGAYDTFNFFFSGAEAAAFLDSGDAHMRSISTSITANFRLLPLRVVRRDVLFLNDTIWAKDINQECIQEALYNLMFSIADDRFDEECKVDGS